jgi:hypothetical protein
MTQSIEERVARALDARHGRGLSTGIEGLSEVLDELALPVSSDVLDTIARRWGARSGEVVIPRHLRAFVGAVAAQRARARVVDPWCNLGQLVTEVARLLPGASAQGVTPRADHRRVLAHVEGVEWITGRADVDPQLLGTSNDLVVCAPPFNARPDGGRSPGHAGGELATVLLEAACASLSPQGEALFVVAPMTWVRGREGGWRDRLAALGCSVRACYWLPSGTFEPHTAIPAVMVHVVRATQEGTFVAELPRDDEGIQVVLDNLALRRDAPDARLGRWLPVEAFRSMPQLLADERVRQSGPRSGRARRLGDIATVASWDPERLGVGSVLIPAEGPSSRPALVASSTADLKERYVAVDAAEDSAVPEYLARYFSSELGQSSRDAATAGTAIRRLSIESVTEMTVYLPEIEVQRAVVDTHARILTLVNELHELDERLWAKPKTHAEVRAMVAKVNHEERFEVWVETLPFPLATILWLYLTQRSAKDRVESLLHFFEAYAQFWAIALLSMFLRDPVQREERQGRIQQVLAKQRQTLELASFGTWRTLVELLTKEGRQLQSTEEGLTWITRQAAIVDGRLLEVLFSKEGLGVLSKANAIRNTFKGHGGIITEDVAREQLSALVRLLAELRQVVGERWHEYLLCRVGTLEYRGGLFVAQVDRVVGTRTPFTSDSIELTGPAEAGRLHLVGAGSRDALPLLPLVKVMPSPRTAMNACYFYNRKTKEGVRFISYHFAEDSDVTDVFDDTAAAVDSLSKGEATAPPGR